MASASSCCMVSHSVSLAACASAVQLHLWLSGKKTTNTKHVACGTCPMSHTWILASISKQSHVLQWGKQGVLLLNVCLTVRAHQANSHAKQGWEQFTDAAIGALNRKKRNVVFLLWGKSAELKAKGVDRGRHHVLTAAHPSGLSANRVRQPATAQITLLMHQSTRLWRCHIASV